MLEHAGHLHEHFVDPIRIRDGRYLLPQRPGFSSELRIESRTSHAFPNGRAWRQHDLAV